LRKFLVLVVLLLLVGAGLVLAPALIPWNQFRDQVAAVLADLTGRQVVIDGDLSLTLLPAPALTVADVRLLDGGENIASVEKVALRVRPLALLSQVIEIESLRLQGADMRVRQDRDGTVRWPIAPQSLGKSVQVESLHFSDSRLSWERPERPTLRLEALTGELTAGGPDGPFELTANATVNDQPLRLSFAAARRAAGGSLPARATLSMPAGKTEMRFSGVLPAGGGDKLTGDINLQAVDSNPLAALLRPLLGLAAQPAEGLGRSVQFGGRLTAGHDSVGIDGIDLQWGVARATGSAEFPRSAEASGSLVLAFSQLDMDALGKPGELPVDFWPSALMEIDLLADEARWRGDTLRDLRLVGRMQDRVLAVDQGNATLPGGTAITLSGSADLREAAPRVELALALTSPSLRDTLAWAGIDLAKVPVERLRQADLNGKLAGKPDDLSVTDLTGSIDTTKLSGAISLTRRERTGLGARLVLDRLDLDAYRTNDAPSWPDLLTPLVKETDLTLDLKADQLAVAGLQAEGLALDGNLDNGAITLRQLAVKSLSGIALQANGRYAGGGQTGGSHLTLTASAPTLAPLFRALSIDAIPLADRLGTVSLEARMVGDDAKAAVDIRAGLLGGTVQIGGEVLEPAGTPYLALKIRTTLPETANTLRLLLPDSGLAGLGNLDLYGELGGRRGEVLTLSALQGNFAGQSLEGTLRWTPGKPAPAEGGEATAPNLDGELSLGALDLDRFIPGLTKPDGDIGLGWTRRYNGALTLRSTTLTLAGEKAENALLRVEARPGLLRLNEGSSTWQGGSLTASGAWAQMETGPEGGPPPLTGNLTLAVKGATLPERLAAAPTGLGVMAGQIDLTFNGTGEGKNPRTLWSNLNGQGKAALRNGTLAGLDMGAVAKRIDQGGTNMVADIRRLLTRQGQTAFDSLTLDWSLADQVVALSSVSLESIAGSVTGSGAWTLEPRSVNLTFSLLPAADGSPPAIGLALKGPDKTATRTADLAALQGWSQKREAAKAPKPAPEPPAASPPKPAAAKPATDPAPAKTNPVGNILDRLRKGDG
jgi:uncharacterized protein involved in outer membrane biogenesis